jgi:hypothetical protein
MSIPRGTLARNSRAKKLAMRKTQDLSDLSTNTRKRRRLARRLITEQPLFAFPILSALITGYDLAMFNRDTRLTKQRKTNDLQSNSARMEFHNELLLKLKDALDNKIVTRLMLNWSNIQRPFVFTNIVLGVRYTFPKKWSLSKIRTASKEMSKLQTLKELDAYWDAATSFGG